MRHIITRKYKHYNPVVSKENCCYVTDCVHQLLADGRSLDQRNII